MKRFLGCLFIVVVSLIVLFFVVGIIANRDSGESTVAETSSQGINTTRRSFQEQLEAGLSVWNNFEMKGRLAAMEDDELRTGIFRVQRSDQKLRMDFRYDPPTQAAPSASFQFQIQQFAAQRSQTGQGGQPTYDTGVLALSGFASLGEYRDDSLVYAMYLDSSVAMTREQNSIDATQISAQDAAPMLQFSQVLLTDFLEHKDSIEHEHRYTTESGSVVMFDEHYRLCQVVGANSMFTISYSAEGAPAELSMVADGGALQIIVEQYSHGAPNEIRPLAANDWLTE